MKVLIACESSGRIRDAFASLGHDATSCDLLPSESPGKHYQGDIFDIIGGGYDLMIAHPPCTYLSYAAMHVWNVGDRAFKRLKGMEFFLKLAYANIPKIALENPLGIPCQFYRKPDQIIHPYYFGEPHLKRTCLWLKGLPKLTYTLSDSLFETASATEYPDPIYVDKISGKKRYFTDATGGYHGEGNSFKKRSVTFQSIANAMAEQWGGLVI